ncbi:MAG TPA: pyridoxal phosphate-dependent aminotransferase [Clostridiales bacterium]|nr:pyridoxal phosphate-dependent aminotransferase [Clostridiales bacterium]
MKYDFKTVVNRHNTGSFKYEQMVDWNPEVDKDVIPYSVADMELKNPPEIVEGLKDYMEDTILGYTGPTQDYYDAVKGWMKRRHNWDIKEEWINLSAGVVSAFYAAVRAFTEPGDGVLLMTPAYYPFYSAIEKNERTLVRNPLIEKDGRYYIDYEDLEEKAKDPRNKIILFCSPHNPVGRVWEKEELEKVADICLRNDVIIVSDEIHNDLIMPGYNHTVMSNISEEVNKNLIVCTAPSKTFNLAGLQTSNIIIPNEEIREKYTQEVESTGFHMLNIFGYKACEIAYNQCEDWLEELKELIHTNHMVCKKFFEENLPEIKVYDLEGTYLQWLDFNALGLDKDELEELMHMEAQAFFDEGYIFGEEGEGFERINLACPTHKLEGMLERVKKAVEKVK